MTNNRFFSKTVACVCLFIFVSFIWNGKINAQTSTSSAETTQNLRERIEKVVHESRDQIEGIIDTLASQKRGFIGEVERITEESLTVVGTKGTEIIPIDETVAILKDQEPISIDEVAVGDWLVVMGLIEDDAFVAKRILVSPESLRPPTPLITLGTIQTIEKNTLVVLPRSEETTVTISITSDTRYEDLEGNSIEIEQIDEETQALIIAYDDNGEKEAEVVRILTVIEEEDNDE